MNRTIIAHSDAQALRLRRVALGIKAYHLASRVGMHPVAYSAIENGRRPLTADLARRIAHALDELAAAPVVDLSAHR